MASFICESGLSPHPGIDRLSFTVPSWPAKKLSWEQSSNFRIRMGQSI